jgi:carbon monoxide dehydrogenase subunit G
VKLKGEYTFDGPQEEVWEMLRDPEVLAAALPGTKSLEQVSENEYEGEMDIRVGPVGGAFSGRIVVSDEQPTERCTLTVEGKGSPGFVKGTGSIQLAVQEATITLMRYEGDLQIGGRLASVGQRMLDTASKSMVNQALEAINAALQARLASRAGGEEVDYQPSSEAEFAAAVARDMVGQLFSPSRMLWIALAIIAVAIIVAVIYFGRGGG